MIAGFNILLDPKISYLYYDGGTYSVTGTVLYNGQPASRKVGLFTLRDKRLIAETWSDPTTGVYTFTELKEQEYFVWSEDYLRVFCPATHSIFEQSNLVFSQQSKFNPDDFVGNGKIWGTVLDEYQNPISKKLILLEDQTYVIVKTTMSDPSTGYYEFANLTTDKKFTIICESTRPVDIYNDIIRAKVQAEVQP